MRQLCLVWILVGFALISQTHAMDFVSVAEPTTADGGENRYILMSGEIKTGDYEKFATFLRKHFADYRKRRQIRLSSPGGNVVEALRLSALLRASYATISVEKAKCASSCFFLYLGGTTRYAEPASLGIHRAYFDPTYFAGLKPDDARIKQGELTKLVNSILDDNGVPQNLKDKMSQTSSSDVYWLSKEEVIKLGKHPAWYEELMIAKCQYAKYQKATKDALTPQADKPSRDKVLDNYVEALVEFSKCERKIVDLELSNLAVLLDSGKAKK